MHKWYSTNFINLAELVKWMNNWWSSIKVEHIVQTEEGHYAALYRYRRKVEAHETGPSLEDNGYY